MDPNNIIGNSIHNKFVIDIFNIIIQAVIALGTITVAILAIWGESIRQKIYSPRPKILPHNIDGKLTTYSDGRRVWFYHLKVINERKGILLKNSRVLLKGIQRKGPDGNFDSIFLPVPHQYIWAPASFTPPQITINNEGIFDFGSMVQQAESWRPEVYWRANDFNGDVKKNEVVRFCLTVEVDGNITEKIQIYEVAWNGRWSDEKEEMKRNLKIREILPDENEQ